MGLFVFWLPAGMFSHAELPAFLLFSCGCLSRRQFWRMGLARIFLSTVGPSYIWDLLRYVINAVILMVPQSRAQRLLTFSLACDSFTLFPNAFLGISKYDPLMTTRRRMLHFAGRAVVISICCVLPLAGGACLYAAILRPRLAHHD